MAGDAGCGAGLTAAIGSLGGGVDAHRVKRVMEKSAIANCAIARRGVRRVHAAIMSDSLYAFEATLTSGRITAGTDEAGAGPLAGPVVAAAVILNPAYPLEELNDSKQVTEKRREILYEAITTTALAWAVVEVSAAEIDQMNILNACLTAMRSAVMQLNPRPEIVLVDARRLPGLPYEQRSIVKGDARCASIAAASIVAKVHRDRLMAALDAQHPEYGFAEHKGYGTERHLEALARLGPLDCHRKTFAPVRKATQPTLVAPQLSLL